MLEISNSERVIEDRKRPAWLVPVRAHYLPTSRNLFLFEMLHLYIFVDIL